jgi:hypothetical protein
MTVSEQKVTLRVEEVEGKTEPGRVRGLMGDINFRAITGTWDHEKKELRNFFKNREEDGKKIYRRFREKGTNY